MRKLFLVWLTLTIASLLFYTPIYMFSNNALDAVEELTPKDLIPITGTRYDDPEQMAQMWESMGIDLSMELIDALEDNARLADVDFDYIESPEARSMLLASGLHQIKASARVDDDHELEIIFGVQPKVFLRSVAQVHGILAIRINNGRRSVDFSDDKDADILMFSLFEKSGKGGLESVDRMVNRFDIRLAQQLEHERNRELDSNPQDIVPPENHHPIEEETVNTALDQENGTSEAVVPDHAQDDQSSQGAKADQIESVTVAGNPSPDKIVIFQYEGKPAYCADEGIDGPNCRGDAATWIGQGIYKQYMDPGSPICIAGEADCKLPEYFPTDIRG